MSDTGSRSTTDPFGPLPPPPKEDPSPSSGVDVIAKLGQARGIEDFELVRHAVVSVGRGRLSLDASSDRLEWSTNAAQVLGIDAVDLGAAGAAYANLLDADNFTSRYEAVMRTASIDEGEGVPFQIEYLFRPEGRGDQERGLARGFRALVCRPRRAAGRSLRHRAAHRRPPRARPASEFPRQLRSPDRHDEPRPHGGSAGRGHHRRRARQRFRAPS